MRMSLTRRWIVRSLGTCLVAAALGGCVSQQEYDRLVDTNRSLSATNADLQAQLDDSKRMVGSLRGETGSAGETITSLQQANDDLRRQLADARAQLEDFEDQMSNMSFTRLDPATDTALRNLANQYPNLVSYDAERGMLRFASDLTFDSGSAVVKQNALDSLKALSNILESSDARPYDVRIVGHTDAQRISATTAQKHPTNMYLSVHRAIAVRDELTKLGVEPARMEVAGWGQYRPAVPNTPNGNTPQNRRVEIYLVRATGSEYRGPSGPSTGSVEVDTQRGPQGIEPIK